MNTDEQLLTVTEVANRLDWSYSTALRYFQTVEGTIIKPGLQARGRTKRKISIPETVYLREVERMSKRLSDLEMADARMRQRRFKR